MQIHISDHTLVPSLLAFLHERVHVIADQVGPNEVEVSLLGSMNGPKRRLELDLMLQALARVARARRDANPQLGASQPAAEPVGAGAREPGGEAVAVEGV